MKNSRFVLYRVPESIFERLVRKGRESDLFCMVLIDLSSSHSCSPEVGGVRVRGLVTGQREERYQVTRRTHNGT